ncbi:MAG: hypothetical protein LBC76_01725 [Treponema sp.]|nr:hypothetical protein [Treponema sp.]
MVKVNRLTQTQLADYANAHNQNSDAYAAVIKNRSNKLNQFHDAFYESGGFPPPDYSQFTQEIKSH